MPTFGTRSAVTASRPSAHPPTEFSDSVSVSDTSPVGNLYTNPAPTDRRMSLLKNKHLLNGIVSLVISVAVTVWLADDEDAPWSLTDMAMAVAISSFLSGFFTSYFAD